MLKIRSARGFAGYQPVCKALIKGVRKEPHIQFYPWEVMEKKKPQSVSSEASSNLLR
jgi:hypothetical protein